MLSSEMVERFAQHSPLTVMARLGLERALERGWMDELFEQERQCQYTRELLFSTTVEVMSLVVLGQRPSVHAAAQAMKDLPVSVQALYGKINKTEPEVVRKLVSGSAQRLKPVVEQLQGRALTTVKGYRLRIVDGNHLPASEKRLKPLRGFRGAALPGHALVVYDPDLQLVVDILPSEDAHVQERVLMRGIVATAQPGELWIADRNFCTRPILGGLMDRGSHFLIREHGASPNPEAQAPAARTGQVKTGEVCEQAVSFADRLGKIYPLRRIELRLKEPTEDGDRVIRLLTNLPKTQKATTLAQTYRHRWRIENLFQRLESVLHSEVRSLGQPRAALLAFGVAVLAYNVLAMMQTAVRVQHTTILAAEAFELSTYFIAAEVRAHYAGMMIAVAPQAWTAYDSLTDKALAKQLLRLAANLDPRKLRSYPRKPKAVKKPGYVAKKDAQRHVATSRVIKQGCIPAQ